MNNTRVEDRLNPSAHAERTPQKASHIMLGSGEVVTYGDLEGGTTLVYEAAWAHAEGNSIRRLAPMAKLFMCQVYRDVTAMSLQVFGGVGFTIDCDAQLYFRRAKQLQLSWWEPRYLEELIASSVLD